MPLNCDVYPGRYMTRLGQTATVSDVFGNTAVGRIKGGPTLWWMLDGRINPVATDPCDLITRLPDPLPVRIRAWFNQWWGK